MDEHGGSVAEQPVATDRAAAHSILSPRGLRLPEALLLSLILHAALLSLQFGVLGDGLPWFGNPFDVRRASVPDLYATLQAPIPPPPILAEPAVSIAVVPAHVVPVAPRPISTRPAAIVKTTTKRPIPVLATAEESTWLTPPTEAKPEAEPDTAPISEPVPAPDTESKTETSQAPQTKESNEALERRHREELTKVEEERRQAELTAAQAARESEERRRSAELARAELEKREEAARAAALVKQEAEERQRSQELARAEAERRLAEQAAKEKMEAEERKRAEAIARAEAERRLAEQAAAKAKADAVAQAAAAEALRQARQAQANALAATAGAAAAQAANESANAGAADPAAKATPALAARAATEPARQRRGSLVGRDPRDIQLVFYGEGWRQKIERLGGSNYPKLAHNRIYDTLVATISINSDGTLAAVRVERSSGYRDLDAAVLRVVELAAPFAVFPPALKNHYDVIDLTGTWVFLEDRPHMIAE